MRHTREREHYGAAVAEVQHAGRTMGVADAYIAAICVTSDVTSDATLVTRNLKDFDSYPGLRLVSPWDGAR